MHYQSHLWRPPQFVIYKSLFDGVMDKILSTADVDVAVTEDDPESILGYAVSDSKECQGLLYYVQVKKYMWRKGIANTLLEALGFDKNKPAIYAFTTPFLTKWRPSDKWQHIPHWMIS